MTKFMRLVDIIHHLSIRVGAGYWKYAGGS
jgi:hypothetical protein